MIGGHQRFAESMKYHAKEKRTVLCVDVQTMAFQVELLERRMFG